MSVYRLKPLLLTFLFLFLSCSIFAEGGEGKKEKFNAGELIIDHVSDAHEWHIAGHVAIPLPIIIYSPTKGTAVFSSSKLDEGAYQGYKYDKGHHIIAEDGSKFYDLSITKNVATILIAMFIMMIMFLPVANKYKRNGNVAPKGLQSAIEPLVIFIRDDVAKASIGEKKYKKYMPYLLTVFFFIWITNMLGLIPFFPGGANVTGNIAVTMTLAVITFIVTMISSRKHYWEHVLWMPGVPVVVKILILTPIEILGVFLKPFVLMIRLFANILAGHIVALSFFSMIFIFGEMSAGVGYGVAIFSWAFTVFMFMLELLVAFLQAYVFTLLSAIYFGSALEEGHGYDNNHHPNEHEAEAAVV